MECFSSQSAEVVWIFAKDSWDLANPSGVSELMPGQKTITGQKDFPVITAKYVSDRGNILAKRRRLIVGNLKKRKILRPDKDGIPSCHRNEFIVLLCSQPSQSQQTRTLSDHWIGLLDKIQFGGDCGVEFNAHDFRDIGRHGVPNMIIVAIDIYREQVEILWNGNVCQQAVQPVVLVEPDKLVQWKNPGIFPVPLQQIFKARLASFYQDCGIAVVFDQIAGVAKVLSVPRAKFNAQFVPGSQLLQNCG